MRRWYYRSIFDELNDMRSYMDSLFQQMSQPSNAGLLPAAGEQTKNLPARRSDLKVDVTEKGDEVIVTADMIAGLTKEDICIDLIDPQSLEISGERKEEKKEEKEGYYVRERIYGSMSRIIPLPKPVTDEGAKASFKDGILKVHLQKRTREPITKIEIE